VDGSAAHQGSFTIRHENRHCTIQISTDIIVLTGGWGGFDSQDYVTQYQLTDGTETLLTSMGQPRYDHACAVYKDTEDRKVLLVSGGFGKDDSYLSSTEVAVYTGGSQLEWREVETGNLPSPRSGLRAVLVDNNIFVTGGRDEEYNNFASVLSWDPSTESWQAAGHLAVGRWAHGVVGVPSSIIESECSAKLLTQFVT